MFPYGHFSYFLHKPELYSKKHVQYLLVKPKVIIKGSPGDFIYFKHKMKC